MNYFTEAWAWIGANLYGPGGVLVRLAEHLFYTVAAVGLAAVLAIPIGWLVGHTRRGRGFVVVTAGAARALPTLGVLTLAGLVLGIGLWAPLVALVVLAFPSILAGSYAGVEAIP
ncbi:MAG: ABC transporter permease, partial [Propionicimonas sp.]|nr:ABC transporter permease [Propionicimonas sp.]